MRMLSIELVQSGGRDSAEGNGKITGGKGRRRGEGGGDGGGEGEATYPNRLQYFIESGIIQPLN